MMFEVSGFWEKQEIHENFISKKYTSKLKLSENLAKYEFDIEKFFENQFFNSWLHFSTLSFKTTVLVPGIFAALADLSNYQEGPKWQKIPNMVGRQCLGPRSSEMTLPVPSVRWASKRRSSNSDRSPTYSQRRGPSPANLQGVHSSEVICSTPTSSSDFETREDCLCS